MGIIVLKSNINAIINIDLVSMTLISKSNWHVNDNVDR